jgi:hypothetical protein
MKASDAEEWDLIKAMDGVASAFGVVQSVCPEPLILYLGVEIVGCSYLYLSTSTEKVASALLLFSREEWNKRDLKEAFTDLLKKWLAVRGYQLVIVN